MEITILGNGGALNNGLHYNSFVIDGKCLCELPPDIMFTLQNNKINFDGLESVYVSHLHGDHIFGFPFFLLGLCHCHNNRGLSKKIKIFAPKDAKRILLELVRTAFSRDNPSVKWMKDNFDFVPVNEKCRVSFCSGMKTRYFMMKHSRPTYGFLLYDQQGTPVFSYMPDTLWNENIDTVLSEMPRAVLIDCNGMKDDIRKVHVSVDDIVARGIPVTGNKTVYYATHLKEEFDPGDSRIVCCRAGDVIKTD